MRMLSPFGRGQPSTLSPSEVGQTSTLSPFGGGRGRKDIKELLLAIEVDRYSYLLEETIVKDNLKGCID